MKERLACCRQSHEWHEEQERKLAHHPELITRLLADLKRRRFTPWSYPFWNRSFELMRVDDFKDYFQHLFDQLNPKQFSQQVAVVEKAHKEYMKLPVCKRLTMPLLLNKEGLLYTATYTSPYRLFPLKGITPRTGGRPRSREKKMRDAIIREAKAQGLSTKSIAINLDRAKHPLTKGLEEKAASWYGAYANPETRNSLYSLFSKVKV